MLELTKTNWKKYILFSVITIVLLSVFFLLSEWSEQAMAGQDAPPVVTIWYSLQGREEEALLQQLDEISAHEPRVLIKRKYVPAQKLVDQTLSLQAAGQGPGIIITSRPVLMELYEKGSLAPVSARDVSLFPGMKEAFSYDGQCYGLPIAVDVPLLFYRTDKVAGIPLRLDTIWQNGGQIAAEQYDEFLFSPLRLIASGDAAYQQRLAMLRENGQLVIDGTAQARFIAGEASYYWGWASESRTFFQAGIPWACLDLPALLGAGGQVRLGRVWAVVNTSVKTVPVLEEPIKIVEEALLREDVQRAMREAGNKFPAGPSYYEDEVGVVEEKVYNTLMRLFSS